MNQHLRTSIGVVTLLLAATVSVNEVNAQSIYETNSGWHIMQSQPLQSQPLQSQPLYGATSTLQGYPSAIIASRIYEPYSYDSHSYSSPAYDSPSYNSQAYSSHWPQSQNQSWSPQYSQSNMLGAVQTQIYQEDTYAQTPPVNLPTFTPSPASVTSCQPGGT